MKFRSIFSIISAVTFVLYVLITPGEAGAQTLLDKLKDGAREVISDNNDDSGDIQSLGGQNDVYQGGTSNFADRAHEYYRVYQARYSLHPDHEDAFREAEYL